jgi:hypothetical protein
VLKFARYIRFPYRPVATHAGSRKLDSLLLGLREGNMKRNFGLAILAIAILSLTGNILAGSAFAQSAKKQLEDCAKRGGTC